LQNEGCDSYFRAERQSDVKSTLNPERREPILKNDFDNDWQKLSQDLLTSIKQWRLNHPKATLSQMEQALDEQLGNLRARMLEDLALSSDAADLTHTPCDQPILCPQCGSQIVSRGKKRRSLKTHHGHSLELDRSYAVCPTCEVGFFPPR
jgi:hypothetical protein